MTQTIETPQENLYKSLTEGPFHLLVPMMIADKETGLELKLPMVVLSRREENEIKQKAYADTRAAFKEVPKDNEPGVEDWKDLMETHSACWTFYYATRLPGDLTKKFFLSKQQVENQYTSEQLGIISNSYMTVRLQQPFLKHLSLDDENAMEHLIDEIIAAGTQPDFFLNGITTHSLKSVIHYLVAERQKNLLTGNGSSGVL